MSEINVKDTLYGMYDAEEINLEPAFEAVSEPDPSEDVRVNNNETEEIGGTETMNTNTYNTKATFDANTMPMDNGVATSSFVEVDRIDADSAYRRITFLKNELNNIKKYINGTNCANMNPVLQEVYGNMEQSFKNAIALESIAVENGSSDSISPIGY